MKARRPLLSALFVLLGSMPLVACGGSFSGGSAPEAAMAAPPSQMAYGMAADAARTESYADYGVNPDVQTEKDRFSTFAIDVDTASYSISRRKLNEGGLPPKDAVRVEEFVNAFDYHYDAPTDKPFAVHFASAPSPYASGHQLLRIALQSKRPAQQQARKAAHLVYLVDTSGSMQTPDKIGLVKESLRMLTEQLKEGDTVAICTYAGDTREVLPPTGIADKAKILEALDALTAGGGTAMSSGMDTAYALASRTLKKGEINRVVVLSDGDANIGPSSQEEILKRIAQYKDQGITLSTVGFGDGNYKDTMMEQLADKGDGNYTYIDSAQQAHKSFVENLDAMLEVVARDVKVQVEFDPAVVKQYRLIGYENRDVADKDFRNDKVDGGEVGTGHSVTAMYDLVLTDQAKDKSLASVRVRYKAPEGGQASELVFAMDPNQVFANMSEAPRSFQLATAITGFAETLRESPHAGGMDITLALAKNASTQSKDEVELIGLMEKAMSLGAKRAPIAVAE